MGRFKGNTGEDVRQSERGYSLFAFTPRGGALATGTGPGLLERIDDLEARDERKPADVVLWDVGTTREVGRFKGHKGNVTAVVFSPDRRTVASAGEDATIRVWDIESFKELKWWKTREVRPRPSGGKKPVAPRM